MKNHSLYSCLLVLWCYFTLVCAGCGHAKQPKDPFYGNWRILSCTVNGIQKPLTPNRNAWIVITGKHGMYAVNMNGVTPQPMDRVGDALQLHTMTNGQPADYQFAHDKSTGNMILTIVRPQETTVFVAR